ncbi:MAG: energy transducer TonB [Gammaproteobacteria bacterium HGW-Gammaproteobacteria-8]|nr:MAG: energy transducer TonB [Gammaproteobacteria bacterium HGW-Gammaproteobacteria-8]
MAGLIRYSISMLIAVAVTVAAFYMMHRLISGSGGDRQELERPPGIRFGPIEIEQDFETKERRKPEPPPPPDTPPPPPDISVTEVDQVRMPIPDLNLPDLNLGASGGPPILGSFSMDRSAEGDVVPLVRINPQYPREAAMGLIEGYVTIEFTITETGSVRDPRVIEARPPRIFDREAIRAILRWKFKPRVVDGVAVERQATQTIEFTLDSL